jgi:hypothetical protein
MNCRNDFHAIIGTQNLRLSIEANIARQFRGVPPASREERRNSKQQ